MLQLEKMYLVSIHYYFISPLPKVFITAEVLKLLNLRKESNNKTDWQKMMKFGRKKKDRVDHILVSNCFFNYAF